MFNAEFELFVSGYSPKNRAVVSNLEEICHSPELEGCSLRIINVSKNPEMVSSRKLLAVPVLIMHKSGQERRMIGVLDDREVLIREIDRMKMFDL